MTKPTQRLIALGRIPNANRYGTRHLVAGDEFNAGANDAKLLLLAKKAKPAMREPVKLSAPPLIVTDKIVKAEKHKVDPTEQPPAVIVPLDPDGNPASDIAPSGAESVDELAAARADYQEALGKRPYHGRTAAELRAMIAENTAEDDGDEEEAAAS